MKRARIVWLIVCWLTLVMANTATAGLINVALQDNGAVATADSWNSFPWGDGTPEKAIDGSHGLSGSPMDSWYGKNVPGWLEVKFDNVYPVEEINVWWHLYESYTYSVRLSTNGVDWITVVESEKSVLPRQTMPVPVFGGDSPICDSFTITPINAMYIKVDITGSDTGAGAVFLLSELEAYAVPEPSTLLLMLLGSFALLKQRTR